MLSLRHASFVEVLQWRCDVMAIRSRDGVVARHRGTSTPRHQSAFCSSFLRCTAKRNVNPSIVAFRCRVVISRRLPVALLLVTLVTHESLVTTTMTTTTPTTTTTTTTMTTEMPTEAVEAMMARECY